MLLIGRNGLYGLIGKIIGQITVGAKPRAAIKAGCIIQHFPLHLIQDGKSIARINHIRVIDRQIKAAGHEQALIKPLPQRQQIALAPQMPFADMQGAIAFGAQFFRQCNLFHWQATLPETQFVACRIIGRRAKLKATRHGIGLRQLF